MATPRCGLMPSPIQTGHPQHESCDDFRGRHHNGVPYPSSYQPVVGHQPVSIIFVWDWLPTITVKAWRKQGQIFAGPRLTSRGGHDTSDECPMAPPGSILYDDYDDILKLRTMYVKHTC